MWVRSPPRRWLRRRSLQDSVTFRILTDFPRRPDDQRAILLFHDLRIGEIAADQDRGPIVCELGQEFGDRPFAPGARRARIDESSKLSVRRVRRQNDFASIRPQLGAEGIVALTLEPHAFE